MFEYLKKLLGLKKKTRKKRVVLNEELRHLLRVDSFNGMTNNDLSVKYDISLNTVCRIKKELGDKYVC